MCWEVFSLKYNGRSLPKYKLNHLLSVLTIKGIDYDNLYESVQITTKNKTRIRGWYRRRNIKYIERLMLIHDNGVMNRVIRRYKRRQKYGR